MRTVVYSANRLKVLAHAGKNIPSRRLLKTLFALLLALGLLLIPGVLLAAVPTGDATSATNYYRSLSKSIGFSTPDQIFETKLDDVASYLGYDGLTGVDLQNVSPKELMRLEDLLLASPPSTTLQHPDKLLATIGAVPFRADDIVATRFFAPKIMNIRDPEATRKLGWRKLVRLRARPGSPAQAHKIGSGIILFNIFTQPGATPFSPGDESINTQVMLVTEPASVPEPNSDGPPALYWLDYKAFSQSGELSLALDATFDSNELPTATNPTKSYFVPDGCVACHGNNGRRSLVNYLDTDHWFDRLDNDFPALKASGLALLFDAGTNDKDALAYKVAFDVIRRFNAEADEQVRRAQRQHDETLASQKWLELHATSNDHVPPIGRAIGLEPRWSAQNANDEKVLNSLNQYCFRCHGTVKFSVFDRQRLRQPDLTASIEQCIKSSAPVGIKMPPDRELPEEVRALIAEFIRN